MEMTNYFTRDTIDQLIPQYLQNQGLSEFPDVSWSTAIIGPVQKLQRNNQWSDSLYEDVQASVIEDILMGENIDSDRDPWECGTLAEQVKTWMDEGKDANDIRNLLGRGVWQKAVQKAKRRSRAPGEKQPVGIERSANSGGANPRDGDGNMVEDKFHPSGFSEWVSSGWSGEDDIDLEGRDLIRLITKNVRETKSRFDLFWQAKLQYPDTSLNQLKDEEVTYQLKGEPKRTEVLRDAFDRIDVNINTTGLYYVKNRFCKWLKDEFGEELEFLFN